MIVTLKGKEVEVIAFEIRRYPQISHISHAMWVKDRVCLLESELAQLTAENQPLIRQAWVDAQKEVPA